MTHSRHPLARVAAARSDHPLLVTPARAWSAAELLDAVASAAGGLLEAGARPGDRIALVGGVDDDWVVMLHAIRWMGASAVPLSTQVPAVQLHTMLAAIRPTLIVTDQAGLGAAGLVLPLSTRGTAAGEHFSADNEVQLILLTSGTTGTPKQVPLTVGQLRASADASAARLGHADDDAWLCCLPGW